MQNDPKAERELRTACCSFRVPEDFIDGLSVAYRDDGALIVTRGSLIYGRLGMTAALLGAARWIIISDRELSRVMRPRESDPIKLRSRFMHVHHVGDAWEASVRHSDGRFDLGTFALTPEGERAAADAVDDWFFKRHKTRPNEFQ